MRGSVVPFTILIDTRESRPWTFTNIPGDSGEGTLIIPWEWQCLGTGWGDYTIKEAVNQEGKWRLSIERKSIDDLYSTILSRRDLFIKELENLNTLEYAAVVVEASIGRVIGHTPRYWEKKGFSEQTMFYKRKRVIRSIIAWQCRYPVIRWWFLTNRFTAQIWAFRLMHRWWKENIVKHA